ncbi:MAG TPA: response regulator receiver domain [Candidatus Baltobacteraceae bacterium]|jgi:hypothetical protein
MNNIDPVAVEFPPLPTAAEKTVQVVRDFLQSVLVVDDRAAFPPAEQPSAAPPGQLPHDALPDRAERHESSEHAEAANGVGILKTPQVPQEVSDPDRALVAPELVEAFARQGLVCGVLTPRTAAETVDQAPPAARRADILVLDWSIDTDNGEAALELIGRLATDEDRHRLRYIAIYTREPVLHELTDRILERLKAIPGPEARKRTAYIVEKGSMKISVFGKLRTARIPDEEHEDRRVAEKDLPGKLITEFSQLQPGIVSTAALAAVSALRRKTNQLLGRFEADLDPAFLWHRAVLRFPEDAEQHIVDILTAEIGAVVEDSDVRDFVDLESCTTWIAQYGIEKFNGHFGDRNPTLDDMKLLLGKGINDETNKSRFQKLSATQRMKGDAALFAASAEAMRRSNETFAELMLLRTRYDDHEPVLSSGTIVRSEDGKYWLCILPACDAVRLKGVRNFAFIPLVEVPDEAEHFDLLVSTQPGGVRLRTSDKVYDLRMINFEPNEAERVKAERSDESLIFTSASDGPFSWIGELKALKAQSLTQAVAENLARPGLDDPEWLRSMSGRQKPRPAQSAVLHPQPEAAQPLGAEPG